MRRPGFCGLLESGVGGRAHLLAVRSKPRLWRGWAASSAGCSLRGWADMGGNPYASPISLPLENFCWRGIRARAVVSEPLENVGRVTLAAAVGLLVLEWVCSEEAFWVITMEEAEGEVVGEKKGAFGTEVAGNLGQLQHGIKKLNEVLVVRFR
ncbi:MAG: hypothetical protein M2R45_01924 [Verrucomicrobia subdivision 3 bacterium]|nr:hypothetical protein [Limisphaerales bacterium]